MMKRILAITLSFMVATMSLPYAAFADYVVNDDNEIIIPSKIDVQFYDVTDIKEMKEGEKWVGLNLETEDKLTGWDFERTPTLGDDNWQEGDDKKAFLRKTSGQPTTKNAQRMTGKFSLDTDSHFQLLSDDGVELFIREVGESSYSKPYNGSGWYVSANNEVVTDKITAGDYEFILDYFNWGGDGKLIFNISTDTTSWTPVDSGIFYLTRTIPEIDPTLDPSEVKVGETIELSSDDLPNNRWTKSFKWFKKTGDTIEELTVSGDEYVAEDDDLGSEIYVESVLSYNDTEVPESKEVSNKVPVTIEMPDFDITFKLKTYRLSETAQPVEAITSLSDSGEYFANAGDKLSVEHASISDDKWSIDYKWFEKVYDLENDEWIENELSLDDSEEVIPQVKGGMIFVRANVKYNGVTMATETSPFVRVNNLYITVDDKHEFYINEEPIGVVDQYWQTVDAYFLPGDDYQETPSFAIKAWDKDDGTATISGFRFEYYGVDGDLMSNNSDWYEYHAEKDINKNDLNTGVVPPKYKDSVEWFEDDYRASWDKATLIDQFANGWTNTSNKFTNDSNWIWSPIYKVNQNEVEGDPITRFTSPVYFRNVLNVDNPPTVSADDVEVVQHADVDLLDYITANDDLDDNLDIMFEVVSGDLLLDGDELNTNQFASGKLKVIVTDSNNQSSSDEFDVVITKHSSDVIEIGKNEATDNKNYKIDLDDYKRLVLLAQMQTANNIDVTANLRNNILKTNLTSVRNGDYDIFDDKFKTFVEVASGDVLKEDIGYLALESGVLLNTEGEIIGEADTVVVDYNDDLTNEDGSYNNPEDRELKDADPEWKDVSLTSSIGKPVVFAQIASYTGSNKTHARISDVSANGFKIFLEEWKDDRPTNHHNHELVSYLAIKPGKHEVYIMDGSEKVKRTIIVYEDNGFSDKTAKEEEFVFEKTEYPSFETGKTETKFVEKPIVMSQVQTFSDKQVWMRQQNALYNTVELFAQHDDVLMDEQVGIMVIGVEAEYKAPSVEITGKERFNTTSHAATVTATDEDSNIAFVEYSLDGENFTKVDADTSNMSNVLSTAAEFTASLESPNVTVYAKATDVYGNESEVVTKDFIYDNVGPAIVINPEERMFNRNLTGTISSPDSDVISIRYKFDNGTWTLVDVEDDALKSADFSTLVDSAVITDTTLYVEVADSAGNVSTTSKVYTHDPTIPNVNFGDQPTEFKEAFKVDIESSTGDTIHYIIVDLGSDAEPDAESPVYNADDVELIHTTKLVKAIAINAAGNESSIIEKTFNFTPELKVTEAVGSEVVVETVTLRYGYNVSSSEGTKQLGFMTNPKPSAENNLAGADFDWKVKSGDEYISLMNNTVTYKNVETDAEGYITLEMTYQDGLDSKKKSVDVKVIVDFVPTPEDEGDDNESGDDSGSGNDSGSGSNSGGNPPSSGSSVSTSSTPTIRVRLNADLVPLEYGASADPDFTTFDFDETVTGTDNKDVTWSISNNDYLEIDQNGVVSFKEEPPTGVEDFSATVTVTTEDGGKTATARVIIEEKTPLGAIEFYEPYIFGYPDQSFRPQNSVTRAEVATMFAKILKLNLDFPGDQKFSDVNADQWYYTYVQAIARTNIFVGTPDGKFNPNEPITRAEMSAVFAKFWQFQNIYVNSTSAGISDVEGHWANQYINMMYNAGIVTGFEDGTFRPNDPTLREQVVGMINTLIARPEYFAPVTKFTDITNKHWAYGNIEAASQNFIFQTNIPLPE
ncbi:S-layer homology domain-containing protein [Acidaminobacter sp. JC074]|uniref:S-layer homology domain-containing protein n=1 Tax=Acidaminobacter sp. JC074 TaxID=2530199 RepID=UPI001F0F542C|nr:Ig-like domain-containing protein [Acidaminobacter sp. JC074]